MSSTDDSRFVQLATKLATALEDAFEHTALTRRRHFEAHPTERPSVTDIDTIITSYANQNFLIAGAANIVSGPWALLAMVPELVLMIRNQIQMIYDLGVAHGKEAHLDAHVLLGIFASVMGGESIGLATVQGKNLLIKRASLRVIQKIVQWLGGKISQRLLKHVIAKWVPLIGAALIATWSRQSTIEIGKRASQMLQHDIAYSDDEVDESHIPKN